MKNSRGIIATVGIAFVIAIGAMAGTAANAAIVSTVGLETAASFPVLAGTPVISSTGLTTIDRAATYLDAQNLGDPSGPLTALGVALTGIGILLLRGRPIRHL